MIIVSACLAGVNCRYDGNNKIIEKIRDLVLSGEAIPLCPEILGGMTIPRVPCEIISNGNDRKVIGKDGFDYTANFAKGAELTLKIAKLVDADKAILQARSPSCGLGKIHDGTFCGGLIDGDGFTASLLANNGIEVINV